MNWKTTVVLSVLVAGLGLWVWLGEEHAISTEELARLKGRVFTRLATKDVTRLTIEPAEGAAVVLVRTGDVTTDGPLGTGTWRMEAPVEDAADAAAVGKVLNALEYAEGVARLEGPEAASFAFGEPVAQVRIEREGDLPPFAFSLGAARPDGTQPLRLEGRDEVVLVKDDLGETLATDAWTYRRKALVSIPQAEVERLTVARQAEGAGPDLGAEELVFTKEGGFWRIDGTFARKNLVQTLLEQAVALRARSALDLPGGEVPARYGLRPPRWTVTLQAPPTDDGEERVERVLLGGPSRDGEEHVRVAQVEGRDFFYEVDATELMKVLGRGRQDFYSDVLLPVAGSAKTVTGLGARFTGGPEFRLRKQGEQWVFEESGAQAAPQPAEELARSLIELRIAGREGAASELDLAALGLDPPRVRIELVEDALRRELHVGEGVEGRPGVYHVLRLGEDTVYTSDLGTLLLALEAAELELLDKTILRASHWDSKAIAITRASGETLLRAEKAAPEGDVDAAEVWQVHEQPSATQADPERFGRFMEAFDQVNVLHYVAEDGEARRKEYGLDQPTTLTVTVGVYKEGELVEEERTLLLGRRDGERIYAVRPDGPAIGLIDAGFLDRLERGFAKGTTLLEVPTFEVEALVVKEGGATLLDLRKPDRNWKQGSALVENADVEDLLREFKTVEVVSAEPASDARLTEVGLDAPRRTITFTIDPFGDDEPTREATLLVGERAADRGWWVTTGAKDRLGILFPEALEALDDFIDAHPAFDFAPVAPPSDGAPAGPTPGDGLETPQDAPGDESASTEEPPAEEAPSEEAPSEEAPVEEAPAEEGPADEAPDEHGAGGDAGDGAD